MADTKISALTNGTTANATDRLPIARAGANYYITPAYIQTYLGLPTLGTGVGTALGVNVGSAGAFVTFNGALGTPSSGTLTNATGLPAGGLTLADDTTNNASTSNHGFLKKLSNSATEFMNGQGNWATPAGGAALSGITAAAAGNTIASGNNHSQLWNWALTSDSVNAIRFGETTAATNGTTTSGVPNQYIFSARTLATSTASPFGIYTRGNHLISASPDKRQLFAYSGTMSAPTYSFSNADGSGVGMWFNDADVVSLNLTSGDNTKWSNLSIGRYNGGSYNLIVWQMPGAGGAGAQEFIRYSQDGGGNPYARLSSAEATSTAFAYEFRKSRGTVSSPTVITTGDDLATISGSGYVGNTGTYVEACRITFDSTGTIANTTSGVGGIIRFGVAKVGAVGTSEIVRLTRATTTGGGWLTMDEADANPGSGDLADAEEIAMYRKADKLVFAYNVGGTINYLVATLDGSTATWTNSTSAP